jgi:hypothetical protein
MSSSRTASWSAPRPNVLTVKPWLMSRFSERKETCSKAPSSSPSERRRILLMGLWYRFYLKMLKQMSIAPVISVPPDAFIALTRVRIELLFVWVSSYKGVRRCALSLKVTMETLSVMLSTFRILMTAFFRSLSFEPAIEPDISKARIRSNGALS